MTGNGACHALTSDDPAAADADTFLIRCQLPTGHDGNHEADTERWNYRWQGTSKRESAK